MITCNHPECGAPARYSGAWKTTSAGPWFWYACEAHKEDLGHCYRVRALTAYEVEHHRPERQAGEQD